MDCAKAECILDAAVAVFGRFGFKKASIDEIAREAKVGKGTIYLVARSKAELYAQAIARATGVWLESTAEGLDFDLDPRALLPQLLPEEVRSLSERPLLLELVSGRAAQVASLSDERHEELRLLARGNLRRALRGAARVGRLRRDLDLEEVAVLLQDLEVATLLFHSGASEALADLHYHRWNTTTAALIEGLEAHAEPPALEETT